MLKIKSLAEQLPSYNKAFGQGVPMGWPPWKGYVDTPWGCSMYTLWPRKTGKVAPEAENRSHPVTPLTNVFLQRKIHPEQPVSRVLFKGSYPWIARAASQLMPLVKHYKLLIFIRKVSFDSQSSFPVNFLCKCILGLLCHSQIKLFIMIEIRIGIGD